MGCFFRDLPLPGNEGFPLNEQPEEVLVDVSHDAVAHEEEALPAEEVQGALPREDVAHVEVEVEVREMARVVEAGTWEKKRRETSLGLQIAIQISRCSAGSVAKYLGAKSQVFTTLEIVAESRKLSHFY